MASTPTGASTSLSTKPESARRLVVRRQLAAPVPFDLERRRSLAMARLLTGGGMSTFPLPCSSGKRKPSGPRPWQPRQGTGDASGTAYEEQDAALGELDNAQSQVRYLQKAFKELGEVPLVEAEDDDDWMPDSSVDALIAARESCPSWLSVRPTRMRAHSTGNRSVAIWAKKIWSSLRALNDYCRAKTEGRFSGDIAMYRDNTPDGAIPLLAEYAADGEQVDERRFSARRDPDVHGPDERRAIGQGVHAATREDRQGRSVARPGSTCTTTRADRPSGSTSATSARTCRRRRRF